MNKIQICIDAVLCAAVIALGVLHFEDKNASQQESVAQPVADGNMPIAYLNTDSLLLNYEFAREAGEKLMSKQEDARLKLNTKARTLQQEMADFQRKVENNAFLSRERAENEQQRLLRKQQELEDLEQKLGQDIMQENQKLNMQLADTVTNFLKQYNADGRYHIILSNNAHDNILQAADSYDITAEVIEALNARYHK